jgi:hypothetical protein
MRRKRRIRIRLLSTGTIQKSPDETVKAKHRAEKERE